MASNRHLCRIIALQTLYEYDFRTSLNMPELKTDLAEIQKRNTDIYSEALEETDFITDLVQGTLKNEAKIDAVITPAAPEWPIDQIAKVDKTILRLSVYELTIKREVPPKVAINEAVELAKSFGGENSSKFINGVLGTIYRQSEYYEPEEDKKIQAEKQAAAAKTTASGQSGEPKKPAKQSESDQSDEPKPKSAVKQSKSTPAKPAAKRKPTPKKAG